jgi:hypothetical protein
MLDAFLKFRAKGGYHQRAEVEGKIQSLVLPSIVEEDHICDDSGLCSLSRSGSDAIEPTLIIINHNASFPML